MAGSSKASRSSPATTPATLKKSTSSQKQKSIIGFFQKRTGEQTNDVSIKSEDSPTAIGSPKPKTLIPARSSSQSLTPAPSSDAVEEPVEHFLNVKSETADTVNGLPSPTSPAETQVDVSAVAAKANGASSGASSGASMTFNSPSRKVSPSKTFSHSTGLIGSRQRRLSAMPSQQTKMTMKTTSHCLLELSREVD